MPANSQSRIRHNRFIKKYFVQRRHRFSNIQATRSLKKASHGGETNTVVFSQKSHRTVASGRRPEWWFSCLTTTQRPNPSRHIRLDCFCYISLGSSFVELEENGSLRHPRKERNDHARRRRSPLPKRDLPFAALARPAAQLRDLSPTRTAPVQFLDEAKGAFGHHEWWEALDLVYVSKK